MKDLFSDVQELYEYNMQQLENKFSPEKFSQWKYNNLKKYLEINIIAIKDSYCEKGYYKELVRDLLSFLLSTITNYDIGSNTIIDNYFRYNTCPHIIGNDENFIKLCKSYYKKNRFFYLKFTDIKYYNILLMILSQYNV